MSQLEATSATVGRQIGREEPLLAVLGLLEEMRALSALAPEQVAAELRPMLAELRARRSTCDQCGAAYLRKRFRGRGRFCHDTCRNRWYNSRRGLMR